MSTFFPPVKLRTGYWYITRNRTRVDINHEQSYLGFLFKTYRTIEGSNEYWSDNGDHQTGNPDLKLFMEMGPIEPPAPVVTVVATPAPTAAPVVQITVPPSVLDGRFLVLHTTVDLENMTAVTSVGRSK